MKYETVWLPTNTVHGHTEERAGVLVKMSNNGPMTLLIGSTTVQTTTIISHTEATTTDKNTSPPMELGMESGKLEP